MNTILAQLKQPSTYRGLAILAGLIGWKLNPSQADAIGAAVIGILGAIEVFRNEKPVAGK